MSELTKIGAALSLYRGILGSVSQQLLGIYICCVAVDVSDSEL